MDEIVEVLGIIGLIAMSVVFFSGLYMKHKRKVLLQVHRIVGYIVFALAICHGVLAMLD